MIANGCTFVTGTKMYFFVVVAMASEKLGNLRMMVEVDMAGMEKSESVGTIWNWNIGISLQISISILYVIRFSILCDTIFDTISDRIFGLIFEYGVIFGDSLTK